MSSNSKSVYETSMRHFLIALLLLANSAAQAAGELPGDHFTHFAGFDLGKGTLSDVQARLGASPLRESGDAGEYEAWICYATPRGEVRFNSGEMGGGTDLLGFTISKFEAADCPLVKSPLPVEIGGLRLGMTRKEFQAATGTDVKWANDVGTAVFEYRETPAGRLAIDASISVIGTFAGDRLVKLAVWKIETN